MQENNANCKNTAFCNKLSSKLRTIEEKCDKILDELSILEKLIIPSTSNVDTLISSMRKCASDLLDQSIKHREYVERQTESPFMTIERR